MSTELRLREHIRRVLSNSGIDRTTEPTIAHEAEDQVLELLDRYISADESEREAVYQEGEERLLGHIVRSLQEKHDRAGSYKPAGRSYSTVGSTGAWGTSEGDTGTRDIIYDLISTVYYLLQGAETISLYIADARQEGDEELVRFFQESKEEHERRADRAKQLLKRHLNQAEGEAEAGAAV